MSLRPRDSGRSRTRDADDDSRRSASEKRRRTRPRSARSRSSSSSSRSRRSDDNSDTKRILRELKEESRAETKARIEHERTIEKRISDLQAAHDRKMDKIVSLVEAKQNEQNKWNKKQHDHNKQQDEKVDRLNDGMASLTAKFDDVLSTFNNFREEAQKATAVAAECSAATAKLQASAAAPVPRGPAATRAATDPRANPALIKVGAKRVTTRQAVQAAFMPHILDSTGLGEDEIRFLGPAAGKNFEVTFKGNQDSAASYVNKILLALREGSGANVSWKRFEVQDDGPDGNIPLFINRDKTPETISREICTRKLLDALRATHTGGELGNVTMDRAFGAVSLDNAPLARVNVDDRSNPTLFWVNATVTRHKINKKSVTDKFLAAASRTGAMATADWSL